MTTALEAMTTAIGMGAAPITTSTSSSPSAVSGFSNNSTSELAMAVSLPLCSGSLKPLILVRVKEVGDIFFPCLVFLKIYRFVVF